LDITVDVHGEPVLSASGILERICEVGPVIVEEFVGDKMREVKKGDYTKFTLRGNPEIFKYRGIIHPDSIGHIIEIYEPALKSRTFPFNSLVPPVPLRRVSVLDRDLNRWYK